MKKRLKRILAWGLFSLLVLVGSGVLLADHLMPPATGAPSHAIPVADGQTALDRELAPMLARHPGKTGAILLPEGLDAFASRAISARQAGRSLDLQYYIWHDDLTGHLLMYEAWKAAERGVRVRMLLDDINTSGKDAALLALDTHPNIEIRVYNPFRNRDGIARLLEMLQRMFSITHRMHNKAWIADNRVAVVGGRNVGMEYFDAAEDTNFRDLDLLLFGPAVAQASGIFDTFWNSEAVVPIAALSRKSARRLDAILAQIQREARSDPARVYLDKVDASPSVRAYLSQELTPIWSDGLRVRHGLAHLLEKLQAWPQTKPAFTAVLEDAFALHFLQRKIRLAGGADAGIQQARDVRMRESREDLSFSGEAQAQVRVGQTGAQQFQRDAALIQAVGAFGHPHLAHAAFAQQGFQTIRPDLLAFAWARRRGDQG